jgi:protein-disulfide isomerase
MTARPTTKEPPSMKPARAALTAALLIALGACSRAGADADKVFGTKVHDYLVAHPEVLMEMQDAYTKKQMTDEASKVEQHIPALRGKIFDDPRDPSVGPRNAKVTVVEFFDYRCPYCKGAAQDYLALIKAHPDVRFVFKEMPLSIHGPEARSAAAAALASNREGKYLQVYSALMADRAVDEDSINQVLAKEGLDPQRVRAAAADPKISAQIDDVASLANTLGVDGTPGFLVNGRFVSGARLDEISKLIEQAKKS